MINDIDRIKKVLNYTKKSKNALGISIGDKNGMRLQHVEKGRNSISDKLAKDINKFYPEISYNWLLTGEGSMLKNKEPEHTIMTNKHGNEVTILEDGRYYITVPLVEFSVYAGKVNEYQDAVKANNWEKTATFPADHYPKGNYLAFQVQGYSMDGGLLNDTPDGTVVLARELNMIHWKDGFNECKYGWIVISKQGMLFKDIVDFNKEQGIITLHSRNSSPEFADFEMKLEDVFQIFKVIKRTF